MGCGDILRGKKGGEGSKAKGLNPSKRLNGLFAFMWWNVSVAVMLRIGP